MRATALLPPAIALPQSPAVAVLLILIVLGVIYALLNLVVRVGQPPSEAGREPEVEEAGEPAGAGAPAAEVAEAQPEPAAQPPAPVSAPQPALNVEAIRVRGVPLGLGDTASQVMRAFRPGEGERMPLIERRPDGKAARVVRAYRVGGRLVVLALQREEAGDPLRLTALDIEES